MKSTQMTYYFCRDIEVDIDLIDTLLSHKVTGQDLYLMAVKQRN